MNSAYPPIDAVREVVTRALAEDLRPLGDITASLLPFDVRASADLVARAGGVLAGRLAATEAFAQIDPSVAVFWSADDGDEVGPNAAIAHVAGPLVPILTAERAALNLLGHLSGVATLTRRYVEAVTGTSAQIRDTRKTAPGLRALEKAAVRAGGGVNHRASLSDGILLKDNHLAGISIPEAIVTARQRWPGRMIEVECDSAEQVKLAVAAGAHMVLLDNMSADQVAECIADVGGRCLVEVSGGITLDNVADYAAAGAPLISVGAITHSAPVLDIALDVQPAI
ncbi:MAG TPA: carboxylating nicotinate-nucleotide diphosphorylase [Acidimicrobiales bacterium]|nr:carboxylating nicotinate-nucleotide diphosphorylase [Acidimicrobiales bacterium]